MNEPVTVLALIGELQELVNRRPETAGWPIHIPGPRRANELVESLAIRTEQCLAAQARIAQLERVREVAQQLVDAHSPGKETGFIYNLRAALTDCDSNSAAPIEGGSS